MTFESQLRANILPSSLTEVKPFVNIDVETQYKEIVRNAEEQSRTVYPAKNIFEVMDLIKTAVEEYEDHEDKVEDARVLVLYGDPDERIETIDADKVPQGVISLDLNRREPGAFGRGPPFEAKVHNLKPIIRGEEEDPDNPGYRRALLGYYYDNIVRATCWARTNKTSNTLLIWLETVMQTMDWWFRFSGAARVIYWGLGKNRVLDVDGQKYYGREIDFFVRTEKIVAVSQKKLERLNIKLQ